MSYADILRQNAKWIREAIDPDFDPLMKITLDDIDVDQIDEAATEIQCLTAEVNMQAAEIERLRAFTGWVDAWVSNEVGSYSVYALDGLFRMTREKLAALSPSDRETP